MIRYLWGAVFIIWGILLSGVFSEMLGAPGIIQALRLRSLLSVRQAQIAKIAAEMQHSEKEIVRLETNRSVQEREIRRTLGYANADELIFDFSH